MPYVMVPVPEEHVEEAMAAVLRIINKGRLTEWDPETVSDFFQALDEPSRALLGNVARAQAAGKDLPQRTAADMIELTERELMGIMREVNERSSEEARPTILMNVAVNETLPNGRTREARVFRMENQLAEWVREAEKRDLGRGHPEIDA